MPRLPFAVYRHALKVKIARRLGRGADPYLPLPEGALLSPSLGIAAAYDGAPRRLGFPARGPLSPEAWQAQARAKLAELTGYAATRPIPEVTIQKGEVAVGDGIVRHSVYLRIRPDTDLPVHLVYRPGLTQPAPVFLHLAGSTSGVHLGWGEAKVPIDHQRIAIGADMARQAAQRGYLAVSIEQIGYGERGERHLAKPSPNRTIDAANHLLLLGRTLMGDGAGDVSAALDWLLSGIGPLTADPDRIFLFGHSAGGTLAQYAAALDVRIRGVLASGSVGPVRQTIGARGAGGGDGIVPGLLNWFDTPDLIALVAPRVFVGLSGDRDHIFPASGIETVVDQARPFFALCGAADRVQAISVVGPHQYHAAASWDAWTRWIDPTPAHSPQTS